MPQVCFVPEMCPRCARDCAPGVPQVCPRCAPGVPADYRVTEISPSMVKVRLEPGAGTGPVGAAAGVAAV